MTYSDEPMDSAQSGDRAPMCLPSGCDPIMEADGTSNHQVLGISTSQSVGQDPQPPRERDDSRLHLEAQLAEQRRKSMEQDQSMRSLLREREIATALTGHALVKGAAAQLIKLWADEFDTLEDAGQYQVRSKDGQSVAQAVGRMLARPEYSHFCQPTTRGGVAQPGHRGLSSDAPPDDRPKTLGEEIVLRWRRSNESTPLGAPIGLKRRVPFE